MYQDRRREGIEHPDPTTPPRRRANSRRGHGTFANDRPPVAGWSGRESGEIRLKVIDSAGAEELDEFVDMSCLSGTTAGTDEWCGYSRVGDRHGRIHVTVDHSGPKSTWAIDADGDGVREVHCHTMEGIWTGLRNFLRPFRGVSKWCEEQYVAMFQWGHNIKEVTDEFIQIMLGLGPHTDSPHEPHPRRRRRYRCWFPILRGDESPTWRSGSARTPPTPPGHPPPIPPRSSEGLRPPPRARSGVGTRPSSQDSSTRTPRASPPGHRLQAAPMPLGATRCCRGDDPQPIRHQVAEVPPGPADGGRIPAPSPDLPSMPHLDLCDPADLVYPKVRSGPRLRAILSVLAGGYRLGQASDPPTRLGPAGPDDLHRHDRPDWSGTVPTNWRPTGRGTSGSCPPSRRDPHRRDLRWWAGPWVQRCGSGRR